MSRRSARNLGVRHRLSVGTHENAPRSSFAAGRGGQLAWLVGCAAGVCVLFPWERVALGVAWLLPVGGLLILDRSVRGDSLIRHPCNIFVLVLLAYLAFFPLRAAAVDAEGGSLLVAARGGRTEVAYVVIVSGLGTLAALLTAAVVLRRLRRRRPQLAIVEDLSRLRWAALLIPMLTIAAVLAIIVARGGVVAAHETFSSHFKSIQLSSFERVALAIWNFGAPPAAWLLGWLGWGRRGAYRWIPWSAGLVLVSVATYVFASRKVLLAMGVGIVFMIRPAITTGRRLVIVLAIAILALYASVSLVSFRTGQPATLGRIVVLENLGHSVLDSALIIHGDKDYFRDYLSRGSRWALPLTDWVPRAVWPTKPSLDGHRLDHAVAIATGVEAWQDTGFPASMFAEWMALFGSWGAILSGSFFGAVGALVHHEFHNEHDGAAARLLYASLSVLLLTYYKDGDIVATLSAGYKPTVFLFLLLAVVGAVRIRPERYTVRLA